MSTKMTIRRIALVAVASLGLGVLSIVPAQAATSAITLTVTNGTKTLGSNLKDTATGALVQVTGLMSAGYQSVNSNLGSGLGFLK